MPAINRADILAFCQKMLTKRKEDYLKELESLNVAAAGETKSSAGDKYETSREMIAQARKIIEINLGETITQMETLMRMGGIQNVQTNVVLQSIAFGSLVETNLGWYFIGASLGEVDIVVEGEKHSLRMISLLSPIGSALRGKKLGDNVPWRGTDLKILRIE